MIGELPTATKVKQALRALARGDIAPDLLPSVFRLRNVQTPIERTHQLRGYLSDLILARLSELRDQTGGANRFQANGRPADQNSEALAALTRDFARGNAALEAWSALYHRYLSDADLSVEVLATAAHVSERQFRRRVEAGIRLLTEQLRVAEMSAQGRLRRLHLDRYLPPPDYLHLFGVQELVTVAANLLADPHGPAMIAFEGMGGIGKTALAQAVAHRLAENGPFLAILWISAQQQRLLPADGALETLPAPTLAFADLLLQMVRQLERNDLLAAGPDEQEKALQALFHDAPYLIIVDNLEAMADHQALVPRLRRMLSPSRAMLTSRRSLRNYPFVLVFPVPPLSPADSRALVHSELMRVGRRIELAEEQELDELCALVGGLPLALKLIAGLLNRGAPVAHIREDLRRAGGATAALYTYIFRRTWLSLTEEARRLLVDMLLISPEGADQAGLEAAGFLPTETLHKAMTELLNQCLVQVTGTLGHPFYRLHPLTAVFLTTDLIGCWTHDETFS